MKFRKTPEELFVFVDAVVRDFRCEKKKMFGGVGYFVNGNMFTGAHQSDLFLRLSDGDRQLIMKQYDEVSPFEPMPGRRMTEYVSIPENVFSRPDMLHAWLEKSFAYASSLAPKSRKVKKRKTA